MIHESRLFGSWGHAGAPSRRRGPSARLGYLDPSSNRVVVQHADGDVTTRTVGRVAIALVAPDGHVARTSGYAWDPWARVSWHEHRKAGGATSRAPSSSSARPSMGGDGIEPPTLSV